MKTDISFLPEIKQKELQNIVDTTLEMCDNVLAIILYGSYARNEYREARDLAPDRRSGKISDYDIMVITKGAEVVMSMTLWHDIGQKARYNLDTPDIRIIAQSASRLKQRLKEHHFFYSDIIREGIMLYTLWMLDQHPFVPETIPDGEKLRIAREHYENWFPEATVFYDVYNYLLCKKEHKLAAFNLHQAAETAINGLLAILTNYVPKDHWICGLEVELAAVFPEVLTVFPRETQEELKRFENFDRSYIGARYEKDYYISEADLLYFAERVQLLIEMAQQRWEEYQQELQELE